jgi:NADH-quinone oxidoreductase subunit J
VQVLLYAGGVVTVVVFAIVVTEKLVGEKISNTSKRLLGGAVVSGGVLAMVASMIQRAGLDQARPEMVGDTTRAIGMSLLTKFLLPFELLGVLLLAGLIAASYFARPEE